MSQRITPGYLKRQLAMDPRIAAKRIVALRSRQLGIATVQRDSGDRTIKPTAAANARQTIQSIRGQFWTLPIDALQQQLTAIDLRPYPELATVVEQLQQAAAVRAEFPKLAQRLGSDLSLFYCIRQSVTMPPRDAAGMKESVMRSILAGENIKAYKSSAKIVKELFPTIYALQPEWFDDILNAKRLGRDTTARSQSFTFGAPNWVFAILFILLMRGCASLMR